MKTFHTLTYRTRSRGRGVLPFFAAVGLLAAGLAWGMPRLDRAAASLKMTSTATVLLHQMTAARDVASSAAGRIAVCRSLDGVSCERQAGGWESGWILYEDRDGDGSRGAGEAVLEHSVALPSEFRLQGDFASGVFTLCSTVAGSGDARQFSLGGRRFVVRRVRVPACG